MEHGTSPDGIRQPGRYSVAYCLVCLPSVALSEFGVILPWVFAGVCAPLGALVGWLTLCPRRTGVLAWIAGMGVAGVASGLLAFAGV
jgi:hypothetical protein